MLRADELRHQTLFLRIVSSIVLALVSAALLYLGPPYFNGLMALAGVVLAWEWVRLCHGGKQVYPPMVVLALAVLAILGIATFGRAPYALVACVIGAIAVFAAARLARSHRAAWVALGAFYIGLPGIAVLWIAKQGSLGIIALFWMFITVAFTDIGAYVAGRSIGGPKLAPRISPNKTWAGLAGGLVMAAVVGAVTGILIEGLDPALLAAKSAIVGIASQVGDLFESAIKRHFGAKDTGGMIPGHGGLFDRIDGHMAAAVMVATVIWVTGESILTWR